MRALRLAFALVALSGCHLVTGADDFLVGAGGTATHSTGGSAGAAAAGGSGGAAVLVSDGLIARYYIDEATSGTDPPELIDAASQPLHLDLTYGPTTELEFVEVDGNQALSWSTVGIDARASAAIDGTKFHNALEGSQMGTVEVVVEVSSVTPDASRFSHIGFDSESGRFTLSAMTTSALHFFINGSTQIGDWPFDLLGRRRSVLHVVFDSSQSNADDRIRLYADGSPVSSNAASPPAQGTMISLDTGRHYVLGNREIGERSFRGELYYAAIYFTALSAADVAHNAAILAVDDDTPSTAGR